MPKVHEVQIRFLGYTIYYKLVQNQNKIRVYKFKLIFLGIRFLCVCLLDIARFQLYIVFGFELSLDSKLLLQIQARFLYLFQFIELKHYLNFKFLFKIMCDQVQFSIINGMIGKDLIN